MSDIYDNLEPEGAFELFLHLARGGRIGVPEDDGADGEPGPPTPRAPRPDDSQGASRTARPVDPTDFLARLVNLPRRGDGGWRDVSQPAHPHGY